MTNLLLYFAVRTNDGIEKILSGFGATPCGGGDFLGLPKWYKYLGSEGTGMDCVPRIAGLGDIWLIVLAVIEMLLRLAALTAIVFMVYGGIRLITARGNPEKISSARTAIQDSIIGLVIAIAAIAIVSYIAGRFVEV